MSVVATLQRRLRAHRDESRADIYTASRTRERLWYPQYRPCKSILKSGKHIPDAKALLLSRRLGSGFRDLGDHLPNGPIHEAFSKVVEAMVASDHLHRRQNNPPCLADVLLAANDAQRACLELGNNQDFTDVGPLIQNCCRVAALVCFLQIPVPLQPRSPGRLIAYTNNHQRQIYTDMVLFPLPNCTRLKARLAQKLTSLLEKLDQNQPRTAESRILAETLI